MFTKHHLKIFELYSIALIGIQICVHWRITIRDEVHSSLHVHYYTTFQYFLLPVPSKVLVNATVGPPLSSTAIVHDWPLLATSRALWSTWISSPIPVQETNCTVDQNIWDISFQKTCESTQAIALRSTFKPLPWSKLNSACNTEQSSNCGNKSGHRQRTKRADIVSQPKATCFFCIPKSKSGTISEGCCWSSDPIINAYHSQLWTWNA